MTDDLIKVEKALGEPFALEFPDYVRKIRYGLITTSVIAIAIVHGGLQLAGDLSFLGLKFTGLTQPIIIKAFFFLNLYMFIHFFWCSIDHFQEWWVRLSGTRVAHVTTAILASEHGDYPNDPRQSTLYNWWMSEAKKISSLTEPLENIDSKLSTWEAAVKESLEGKDPNVVNACMSIRNVSSDIHKLKRSIENAAKTIEAQRIPTSLERFDKHFYFYLRSQNLRWLIFELGFPITLGGYTLAILGIAL